MARDDTRDVELGARPARSWDDEDLPQPRDHSRPWFDRVRVPLIWLAATALVVIGFVKLNASTGHGGPTATATSSPGAGSTFVDLSTASVPVNIPTAARAGALTTDGGLYATCPDDKSCTTTDELPAAVLVALARAYPGVHTAVATTVTVHDGDGNTLLYREISYDVGPRHVVVQVLPVQVDTPASGSSVDARAALVYAQDNVQHHTVRVTVVEPAARTQSTAVAMKLCADERLLDVA